MTAEGGFDLVLLVPGKDEREAFDTLLSHRQASLEIRSITYQVLIHPRKDAGVCREAPEVVRSLQRRAERCLVVFDHEGSGQENLPADEVEDTVRRRLRVSGWGERAEVLVIRPELEVWVWSDSPHVATTLGWVNRDRNLRDWLRDTNRWPDGPKPPRPRECMLATLRATRVQYSAALFRPLAEKVSLERCQDRSFGRLKGILQNWFPKGAPHAQAIP